MGIKDVIKKLNLSGTGAKLGEKLAALRQKLPFKRKQVEAEHTMDALPTEASSEPATDSAPIPEDSTGLMEMPKPKFYQGLGEKLRMGAAKVGGLFKRKSSAAPDNEPSLSPDPNADQLISAPEGSAFARLISTAKARAKTFSADFRVQAATLARQLKENFPKNLEDLKKIQPDELFERMRQLTGGRASGTYLRLGAAAFAAYFLADTVSLFTDSMIPDPPAVPAPIVRQHDDKRRSVTEYASITARNIFSSKNIIPSDERDPGVAVKTNLPLTLIGTVVLKHEIKSIATIEDKSQNMVFPVRIDDTISDKVVIRKIEHLKVTFLNKSTGKMEYVEIIEDLPAIRVETSKPAGRPTSDGGVTRLDDTHMQIESKVIKDGMANLNEVLQQARAIPNFENGMPDGYKILQIVPGSIFDKLGIKNGDVVTGLNGEPMNDPGKALGLLNDLPNAKNVEIAVKRGGRKVNMNYEIR